MTQPTPATLLESQIADLKAAGANVVQGTRTMKDNQNKNKIAKSNQRALEVWMPRWIRNSAANYHHIRNAPSLGWLRSCAVGLPVFIVGIGPSLDQEIEQLAKVGCNGLIVATDAALRPLLANRIVPHLVVNYDCKAEQYTLFEGLEEFTKDIVLVANSCTDPVLLATWAGPVLFFNMQHPGVEFMDISLPTLYPAFGPLSNHGTVGNAAILLAYAMGADPIITVGMDLCYQKIPGRDGYRYRCRDFKWRPAQGTYPGEWDIQENKVLYDNDDRLATTYEVKIKEQTFKVDDPLEFYRKGAISLIGTMGNIHVIDCSPGGILGAVGIQQMPLKDAIEEYCSKPIEPGQSVLLHLARLLPRLNDAKGA